MSESNQIPLYLFTYNCNHQQLSSFSLLPNLEANLPDEPSKIYVFGLQEFCNIENSKKSPPDELIIASELFLFVLNWKYENLGITFSIVGMDHIGTTGLILISPCVLQIENVRFAKVTFGKWNSELGSVGVRLKYYSQVGSSDSVELSFACIKLCNSEGQVNQRNQDLLKTITHLTFVDGYGLIKPDNHSFILGDLGYRTNHYQKYSRRLFLVQKNQEESYLLNKEYDELTKELKNDQTVLGFSEPDIKFRPTYKFLSNEMTYDETTSPSWCDRILYQSSYSHFKPLVNKYDCVGSPMESDHLPVSLHISIPFTAPESQIPLEGYLKIGNSKVSFKPTIYEDIVQNISEYAFSFKSWLILSIVVFISWLFTNCPGPESGN